MSGTIPMEEGLLALMLQISPIKRCHWKREGASKVTMSAEMRVFHSRGPSDIRRS